MKKIVIVGGGTSGWLTASYLKAKLKDHAGGLAITLIESSDIPTIGVGEATTPSIRATLADIGFDEYDFMRMANATFKHGILFKHWTHAPENAPNDEYFHPFERPLRAGTDGIESYWLRGLDPQSREFQDAVSIQHQVARMGLAPKTPKDKPYNAPLPYAYHLDAGRLAEALKAAGKQRGVEHIVDQIISVQQNELGNIASVSLKSGNTICADVFIDCSGFASILIEKTLNQDFKDCSDILFCDSAVTMQVKNKQQYDAKSYTTASAQKHGWIWDIGLSDRRGTGYVWSSKYSTPEEAEAVLLQYHNAQKEDATMRHLKFRVGYRKKQWANNCIAVGLSSGFIEPLESTGIHLVEQAIWSLATLLPRYFNGIDVSKNFNSIMCNHYEMAMNFVKYHYILSKRTDSQFWLDNVDQSSWTDWLCEKNHLWQGTYPDIYDLDQLHTIFDHGSYQYVYFGMHKKPNISSVSGQRDKTALRIFEQVNAGIANARKRLPTHIEFLQAIHARQSDSNVLRGSEDNIRINASIRNVPSNYKASI